MKGGQAAALDVQKQFQEAGFEVVEVGKNPESIEVRKYNCTRTLELNPKSEWIPVGPPYFSIRGLNYALEDRGYQKFWHLKGKRVPVRRTDLMALHRFDEEVRTILGLRSLYHESLGSTCARSVYDRLRGRPDK